MSAHTRVQLAVGFIFKRNDEHILSEMSEEALLAKIQVSVFAKVCAAGLLQMFH